MTQLHKTPPGFIADGSGPEGGRYGRCPTTQLAYKRDGSLRKKRVTRSPLERLAVLAEQERAMHRTEGRKALRAVPTLRPLANALAAFVRRFREARAYATPEAVERRRAYYAAMLAACDGKAEAAGRWLPKASKVREEVGSLYADLGRALTSHLVAKGREPTPEEVAAMVEQAVPQESRDFLLDAAGEAGDPFAPWRRADLTESDEGPDDGLDADEADAD